MGGKAFYGSIGFGAVLLLGLDFLGMLSAGGVISGVIDWVALNPFVTIGVLGIIYFVAAVATG